MTDRIGSWSVKGCEFPALTPALIESAAGAMFSAMEEMDGGGTATSWGMATDGVRECWRLVAKRAYGAIAIAAGAKPDPARERVTSPPP